MVVVVKPMEHRHPLLAGALAGGMEICCTFPLEYVKTQLQLTATTPGAGAGYYTGSLDCIHKTVARHGLVGLYRGLSSNLLFAFPRTGIRFYVYELVLRSHAAVSLPDAWRVLLAGAVAGFVEAASTVVPMTTIQVRLVADQGRPGGGQYSGLFDAIRSIYRAEGLSGLYLGAGPTLLKITFNVGGRFLLYDKFTRSFGGAWDDFWLVSAQSPMSAVITNVSAPAAAAAAGAATAPLSSSLKFNVVSMLAGAAAGAITVVTNHPVDTVKTQMQSSPRGTYSSALQCARQVAAQGGLYRGLVPRLNRVILETGLSFTFYQHLSVLCNQAIDGRG